MRLVKFNTVWCERQTDNSSSPYGKVMEVKVHSSVDIYINPAYVESVSQAYPQFELEYDVTCISFSGVGETESGILVTGHVDDVVAVLTNHGYGLRELESLTEKRKSK